MFDLQVENVISSTDTRDINKHRGKVRRKMSFVNNNNNNNDNDNDNDNNNDNDNDINNNNNTNNNNNNN